MSHGPDGEQKYRLARLLTREHTDYDSLSIDTHRSKTAESHAWREPLSGEAAMELVVKPMDAQQPARARRLEFHPRVSIVSLACLLRVAGLGVARVLWPAVYFPPAGSTSFARQAGSWPRSPWLNSRPEVKYVGDAACARCHPDIADTFRRHPMGRSLAPIASAPKAGFAQSTGSATFAVAPSLFTIERREGREIHREAFVDGGKVVAQVEADPGAGSPGQKPRESLCRMPYASIASRRRRAHRRARSPDPEGTDGVVANARAA